MFCQRCGKEIQDNAVFCRHCGEKQKDVTMVSESIEKKPRKKMDSRQKKKLSIGIGAIVAVMILGSVIVYPKISSQILSNRSKENQIAQYEQQLKDMKTAYSQCIITEDEKNAWEEKVASYEAIEKEVKNYNEIKASYGELEEYLEKLEAKNRQELGRKLTTLEAKKMFYATADEIKVGTGYKTDMESYLSNNQFIDAQKIGADWEKLIVAGNEKKDGLSVQIVQEDYSNFPNIRLYLDIVDAQGNVVTGIPQDMFFVSEKTGKNKGFTRATIENASQLNEKEALNMNLVVDTSGSMDTNGELYAAQEIMSNFINTVQFSAGDSVRLTAFESDIYARTDFLTDANELNDVLYSLEAGGGTRLYDTLMRAVQDTNVRNGAKCVIAFTDGMDIESVNGPEDVVNTAKFYGVPIYIVRIGDDLWYEEENALRQIAEGSGGGFYTSDAFNDEVGSIYSRIYRDMKQYYVVEYTTTVGKDISSDVEYEVYVRDGENGGYNTGSYQASEDVFGNLYWNFLQAYITDMNNYEYSEMSNYIDSNIKEGEERTLYKQMQKQVSRGFEDVDYENLLTVDIQKIEKKNDDLYLLYSKEEYDSVYTKTFEELKAMKSDGWSVNRSSANQAFDLLAVKGELDSLMDYDRVTVYQVTHQSVVYQIRKASDGKWKFYKYDQNIKFENPDVYRVGVNGYDLY